MHTLIPSLFIFLFGLVIGSFLNVVALRYNTGLSIGRGRSECFSCGKALSWKELIPLLSFIWQKGRCSGCGSKISWQYPIVELCTAILFVAVALKLSSYSAIAISWVVMSILVVIAVYDLKHKIIPDGLVALFCVVSLGGLFLNGFHILDMLAGPILFVPFFLLWLVSGGRWIGLGDGKLAWGMGWFLGLVGGISAVAFAFWIGAGVSVVLLMASRLRYVSQKLTIKSEIPFAPFLIIGTLIVFFFGFDPIGLHLLLGI